VRILMDPSSTDSPLSPLWFLFPFSILSCEKISKAIRKITRDGFCMNFRATFYLLYANGRELKRRMTACLIFSPTQWQHTTHPTVPRVSGRNRTDATATHGVHPPVWPHGSANNRMKNSPLGRQYSEFSLDSPTFPCQSSTLPSESWRNPPLSLYSDKPKDNYMCPCPSLSNRLQAALPTHPHYMFILKTIKKRNWTAMNPTTWKGNQLTLFSISFILLLFFF
jgi:hypothetical protein